MSIHSRLVLIALTIVALVLAMIQNWGFYAPAAVCCLLTALVLGLAACVGPARSWRAAPILSRGILLAAVFFLECRCTQYLRQSHRAAEAVYPGLVAVGLVPVAIQACRKKWAAPSATAAIVTAVALVVSGEAVPQARLFYEDRATAWAAAMLKPLSAVGFLAVVWLVLGRGRQPLRLGGGFAAAVVLLFTGGAALRACAVLAVPDPDIDVFRALQAATDHLTEGTNPYGAVYGPYPESPQDRCDGYPFYPPLPFLVAAPFRACGLDVRWANVACDLIAAAILLAAGWCKGSPRLGALAAGASLNLPLAPFLIEQAWYEPMIAALLGGGLLLADQGWLLGFVLLGLGLAGKQYGLILAGPVLAALRRRWLALLGATVAVAVLTILPFLLANCAAFRWAVVDWHAKQGIRPEGLTLYVALMRESFRCPPLHQLVLSLPGVAVGRPTPLFQGFAVCLVAAVTLRTPARGVASAPWLAMALLAFCFFHTQCFFNYEYLAAYLLLLGLVGLGADPPVPAPVSPEHDKRPAWASPWIGSAKRLGDPAHPDPSAAVAAAPPEGSLGGG